MRVAVPLLYLLALVGVAYLTVSAELRPSELRVIQRFDHTYPPDPSTVERPKVTGPPPSVPVARQVRAGSFTSFGSLGHALPPGSIVDLGHGRFQLRRPVGVEGAATLDVAHQTLGIVPGAFLLVGDGGSVRLVHSAVIGLGHKPTPSAPSSRGFVLASRGGRLVLEHDRLLNLGHLGVHAYGLSFQAPAPGSKIVNSTIEGNYFGVYLTHASGVRIAGNHVSNSIVYGIDPHTASSRITIQGNTVTASGVHGIILADRVTRTRVVDNSVSGAVDHGIVVFNRSDGNTLAGNHVTATFDGIVIQDASRNRVSSNTVEGVRRFGLRVSGSSVDNSITGNTFAHSLLGAYVYAGPTGTSITGNAFNENRENVRVRRDALNTVVRPVPAASEIAQPKAGVALPWWLPLSLLGAFVWGSWFVRQVLGLRYRPATTPHVERTSVIVPVFREDLHILEPCLASWQRNGANEIVLVIDHSEHELIPVAEGWAAAEPTIRVVVVQPPGKRHALAVGVREATNPIVLLTDSDTMWEDGFLPRVLSGFADPTIGGVGCRQNVYRPGASLWRRVADWMLDVRFIHTLPAMARHNAIPCISGRTAAYRREVILPLLDELEHETFLGRPCVSGDDGRLTWLILREGWGAAYQMSARAWTAFPNTFRGFVKQRVRWSRNSYRCYTRAMATGLLWRQPVVTSVSVIQNLAGPFTLSLAIFFLVRAIAAQSWGVALIAAAWLMAGRAIKGIGHLVSEPEAILFVPLVTVVFIFVMIPVKLYSLLTMNRQGWITRLAEGGVAEGQGSETFEPE